MKLEMMTLCLIGILVPVEGRPDDMTQGAMFWSRVEDVNLEIKSVDDWLAVRGECENRFEVIYSDAKWKPTISYFVDQFGQHGAHSDLKWALSAPWIMLPYSHPKHVQSVLKTKKEREIACAVSRRIVERCLADKEFLDRYYKMVLWSGTFFGSGALQLSSIEFIRQGLREHLHKDKEGYWWFARNFVILAHGTGRSDLLQDADPSNLQRKFEVYDTWLTENIYGIVVDPDYPRWVLPKDAVIEVPKDASLNFPELMLAKEPFCDWDVIIGSPPRRLMQVDPW